MKTEFKKAGDVMFHEIAKSYFVNMSHGHEMAKNTNLAFTYWWHDAVKKINWLDAVEWTAMRDMILVSTREEITEFLLKKLPSSFRIAQEEFAKLHNEEIIKQLKKEYYPGV